MPNIIPQQTQLIALGVLQPTPGTPIPLTQGWTNYGYFDATAAGRLLWNMLSLQWLPSNSGLVYILTNVTAANTTNYNNVVAVLSSSVPVFNSIIWGLGAVDVNQLWVDVANNGDGVIGFVRQ